MEKNMGPAVDVVGYVVATEGIHISKCLPSLLSNDQ